VLGLSKIFSQQSNVPTATTLHPNCSAAFQRLPIDFLTAEPVDVGPDNQIVRVGNDPAQLRLHFEKFKKQYLEFDQACFFPWICRAAADDESCLKPWTRRFIGDISGVLFREFAPNKFQPYCSAFRISRNRIATASHCVEPLMTFRLLNDPSKSLKVTLTGEAQDIGIPNSDLQDYAILAVEESRIPFDFGPADFSRETLPDQAIAIISISMPVFEAMGLAPSEWLEAVRFTRLSDARLTSMAAAGKGDTDAIIERECLLHRMETFAGMSGAPIVAYRRPIPPAIEPRFFVVGIHLRNGYPPSRCGNWSDFNIGLRLPLRILSVAGNK
jgi:hypothetical protein